MRRAGLIYPNGKSWLYDTERVKINDVIFFAHVEFCKDNNVLVDQEHNWLPVTGGFLLFKWRWAVVIEVYRANLKLRILTTFSRTSMSAKRRQRIYDEITGKWESALRDYVHVVAVDNTSESVDQPGCFENDMRVRWEASYDILPSSKKDSFMNLNAEYLMLDGTPLQIRGWIVTEDIVKVDFALGAVKKRSTTARGLALNERIANDRIKAATSRNSHVRNSTLMEGPRGPRSQQPRSERPKVEDAGFDALEYPPTLFAPERTTLASASPAALNPVQPEEASALYSTPHDLDSWNLPSAFAPKVDNMGPRATVEPERSSKMPATALEGLHVHSTVQIEHEVPAKRSRWS